MSRTLKDIAFRLEITREALKKSAADIARETSISANEWSQYINPDKYKRRITIDHVQELKDVFGFTLEWVYDGELPTLREPLRSKVRALMRRAAA